MRHIKLYTVDNNGKNPFWKPNSFVGYLWRILSFLVLFSFFLILFLIPKTEPTPTPEPGPVPDPPIPHTGDVQIMLEWHTKDDLDLQCIFSDGALLDTCDFKHRVSKTGGMLDVDSNCDSDTVTRNPIENIYWPEGEAPKGHYEVSVGIYQLRSESIGSKPFTISIKYGDDNKTITGDIADILSRRGDSYQTLFIYTYSFDLD